MNSLCSFIRHTHIPNSHVHAPPTYPTLTCTPHPHTQPSCARPVDIPNPHVHRPHLPNRSPMRHALEPNLRLQATPLPPAGPSSPGSPHVRFPPPPASGLRCRLSGEALGCKAGAHELCNCHRDMKEMASDAGGRLKKMNKKRRKQK